MNINKDDVLPVNTEQRQGKYWLLKNTGKNYYSNDYYKFIDWRFNSIGMTAEEFCKLNEDEVYTLVETYLKEDSKDPYKNRKIALRLLQDKSELSQAIMRVGTESDAIPEFKDGKVSFIMSEEYYNKITDGKLIQDDSIIQKQFSEIHNALFELKEVSNNMSGQTCELCGGDIQEIIGGDGAQCDTCGFIIRSDGSEDRSEMGIETNGLEDVPPMIDFADKVRITREADLSMLEIERKWLIKSFPNMKPIQEYDIEQSYLCTNPEVRVRKRIRNNIADYKLTIKGKGDLVRKEPEICINESMYNEVMEIIDCKSIRKEYKVYELNGKLLECSIVDKGTPTEFMYCEVEFETEKEAVEFELPESIESIDVTYDKSYKMASYWERTRKEVK